MAEQGRTRNTPARYLFAYLHVKQRSLAAQEVYGQAQKYVQLA